MQHCPKCGEPSHNDFLTCPMCGQQQQPVPRKLPSSEQRKRIDAVIDRRVREGMRKTA